MSKAHSELLSKYKQLSSQNSKQSNEIEKLKQNNEIKYQELQESKAKIRAFENGDLSKSLIKKTCTNALNTAQFNYSPTKVKLMLNKKQTTSTQGDT